MLAISELFGDSYLTHIMLPVFLVAVGDDGDLAFFPSADQPKIRGTEFQVWRIVSHRGSFLIVS